MTAPTTIYNLFPCPQFTWATLAHRLTMTNIDMDKSIFPGNGAMMLKAAGTAPAPCARCENISVSDYQGEKMVMSAKTVADDADATSIGPAPFYVEFDTGDTCAPNFKKYGKSMYHQFVFTIPSTAKTMTVVFSLPADATVWFGSVIVCTQADWEILNAPPINLNFFNGSTRPE